MQFAYYGGACVCALARIRCRMPLTKCSGRLLFADTGQIRWQAGGGLQKLVPRMDRVQREDNMKHFASKSAVFSLVLALIMTVVINTATPLSAADTGFAVPSSWANIPGFDGFNQPQEGRVSDDGYAVETGSDNCSVSYYGFPFSIPSGNVIDGIVITVEGSNNSDGSDKGLDVSLSYDNGTTWTATKNTGVMTTSDNTYTLGGAADTWGYSSWTPATINSDYFRVRLDVTGTDGTVKIDSTQATVYYSLPDTTTVVSTSCSPSTYGDSVTFTATVTRSQGTSTPTGTVAFRDGGLSIGTGTLSGSGGTATATFATSSLAAGSHTLITAVYGGDSNFDGSTSSFVTQAVNQRNITVTADAQTKVYGDSDPALTCQITSGSLVSGDNFTGALTRAAGELAGTYDIQQGTLALSSNYNLTFVGAILTITARPITILPPVPTVDDIGPKSGHAGETLDIVIDGNDFTGATDVDFGPGVTVNSLVVDSPTRIRVNVTIDPGASLGLRDVIVTTPSGNGTLTEAFNVKKESAGGSASWWAWLLGSLLALGLGFLIFFLFFRRSKKQTLWDVRARHAYS
jgi:MBG domain (YGX type)/Bacterial Ig-like domain (group 3)/Quinohemoprotein amine dehydrogenase, alpha subunit domain III